MLPLYSDRECSSLVFVFLCVQYIHPPIRDTQPHHCDNPCWCRPLNRTTFHFVCLRLTSALDMDIIVPEEPNKIYLTIKIYKHCQWVWRGDGKKNIQELQNTSCAKYISVRIWSIYTLKYMWNLCLAVTYCQSSCCQVLEVCKYKDKCETVCGEWIMKGLL